jgi:phosphate transport system substrate-binding protein
VVAIDDGKPGNGDGAIEPDARTIRDGSYQPLSRPLFVYVSATALGHRQTQLFLDYYLDHAAEVAIAVGDVPLPPELIRLSRRRFVGRQLGSAFSGAIETGLTVAELLEAETATVVAEPAAVAKPTATN